MIGAATTSTTTSRKERAVKPPSLEAGDGALIREAWVEGLFKLRSGDPRGSAE
jgi:hypothetical protein